MSTPTNLVTETISATELQLVYTETSSASTAQISSTSLNTVDTQIVYTEAPPAAQRNLATSLVLDQLLTKITYIKQQLTGQLWLFDGNKITNYIYLPEPTIFHSLVVVNNTLYRIGGLTVSGSTYKKLDTSEKQVYLFVNDRPRILAAVMGSEPEQEIYVLDPEGNRTATIKPNQTVLLYGNYRLVSNKPFTVVYIVLR